MIFGLSYFKCAVTFQSPVDLSSSDDEAEFVDEKLDRSAAELKKISTGMGQVRFDIFLKVHLHLRRFQRFCQVKLQKQHHLVHELSLLGYLVIVKAYLHVSPVSH